MSDYLFNGKDWSEEKIKEVMGDMTSGDFEHLIEVFDLHLGSIYVLERAVYEEEEDY